MDADIMRFWFIASFATREYEQSDHNAINGGPNNYSCDWGA